MTASAWRSRLGRAAPFLAAYFITGVLLLVTGGAGLWSALRHWDRLQAWYPHTAEATVTVTSLLMTAGITFCTLAFSDAWYRYYTRYYQQMGILDATERKGRNPLHTATWIHAVKDCRFRMVLIGASQRGWFYTAWNELQAALETLNNNVRVEVYLLNPAGKAFEVRVADDLRDLPDIKQVDAYAQMAEVYDHLSALLYEKKDCFHAFVIDSTPFSMNLFDNRAYVVSYLPGVRDSDSPTLYLDFESGFATQYRVALNDVRKRATELDYEGAQAMRNLLTSKADELRPKKDGR